MDNTDDKIAAAFARLAGPLLERLGRLEERVREREFEMMVYRNAYDNLIKELNEMKNRLKMVPAGKYPRIEALIADFEKRQTILASQKKNLDF